MAAEGHSFGEKYELIERIATGGMAEIYRARYRAAAGITKQVVIKKILPHYSGNPAFVQMFRDEARIVVGLSHGNIAQVFDFGEVNGEYYLAMEHVHGQPLSKLVRRMREQGIPAVPGPFACFIALEMCKGLHYAHTRTDDGGRPLGIVHRDVSPQNVLLGYDGQVKLVDFGIAKARTAGRKETEVGALKGKYVYFAPEQARGKELDARTDVFAAGIVLYEMLCGRLPFEGKMMDVLTRIVRADFPRPRSLNPDIPPALERIILTAMALEKEERYQSAQAMQEALAGYLYAHAPTFNNASLAHLACWLYGEELGADGRTVAVPRDFLEQIPLWKRSPVVPSSSQPSSGSRPQSQRRSERSAPRAQRPEQEEPERGSDVTSVERTSRNGARRSGQNVLPPDAGAAERTADGFRPRGWPVPWRTKVVKAARALGGRRLALVAVPVAAALIAAAVVMLVGGQETFALQLTSFPAGAQVTINGRAAEGRTPMLVSRLPADREARVEIALPGMRRAVQTVKPVNGGTVPLYVVLQPGADVPFEARWPVTNIPLQTRHHGFAVAPTTAARVRLDPKRSYRVWTEAAQAPVLFSVEGTEALGSNESFGELTPGPEGAQTIRAATAFYAFTLGASADPSRDGLSARVRLQELGKDEVTTLVLDHRIHAVRPGEDQRFTLTGLDPQTTYELRLQPNAAAPARLKKSGAGALGRVLLFTDRTARLVSAGAPLRVTGESQLSFALPDDGLDDNEGELLIAVTATRSGL